MRYIRVEWKHRLSEYLEPVRLYSELDDNARELRKVEIFADGRCQFAGPRSSAGDTQLSIEPLPSLDEINKQAMFFATEIENGEFEEVWAAAQLDVETTGYNERGM